MTTSIIKNKNLIVKNEETVNGRIYTIKNKLNGHDVKLGDVFKYLPYGIIDKSETGIGGTSLELDAKRFSIIVQPYVLTAAGKAHKPSIINQFEILFYGKNPYLKGKKNTIKKSLIDIEGTLFNNEADRKLSEYIDRSIKAKKPVKITCVTDQLASLKKALNEYKENFFDQFHLVLDEIDCLQEHSNFRRVMESCIDIYINHPLEKRTLISATIKHFSDPKLKKELFTTIAYKDSIKKEITFIQPIKLIEETYEQIKNLSVSKNEKIVIACNNVEYCLKLSETLSKEPTLQTKTIKILCSIASENKVKNYFDVIKEDGNLPGDINFITSAYFNGLDINEAYHNLIIADGLKNTLRLSASVIYHNRPLRKIVRCHGELVEPFALPAQILRQAQDDPPSFDIKYYFPKRSNGLITNKKECYPKQR